jgi:anti-sigma factor RsiW
MTPAHVHGGPRCRELLGKLSEYLDGELDLSACGKIEEHMEDCPPCQAFLESLRRTVEHLRHAQPAAIPEDVKREIVEAWRRIGRDGAR